MPDSGPKSLMRRALEAAIRKAFTRAYHTIKVDPEKYMEHLRMAYGLPAITYDGVFGVEMHTLDHIAEETIRASMKMAAAEGAGLGMGGLFTVIPDLGILAAITMRMIQKLSLMYGFPYNTERKRRNFGSPPPALRESTSAVSWWKSSLCRSSCRALSSVLQPGPAPKLRKSGRLGWCRLSAE